MKAVMTPTTMTELCQRQTSQIGREQSPPQKAHPRLKVKKQAVLAERAVNKQADEKAAAVGRGHGHPPGSAKVKPAVPATSNPDSVHLVVPTVSAPTKN